MLYNSFGAAGSINSKLHFIKETNMDYTMDHNGLLDYWVIIVMQMTTHIYPYGP